MVLNIGLCTRINYFITQKLLLLFVLSFSLHLTFRHCRKIRKVERIVNIIIYCVHLLNLYRTMNNVANGKCRFKYTHCVSKKSCQFLLLCVPIYYEYLTRLYRHDFLTYSTSYTFCFIYLCV